MKGLKANRGRIRWGSFQQGEAVIADSGPTDASPVIVTGKSFLAGSSGPAKENIMEKVEPWPG